ADAPAVGRSPVATAAGRTVPSQTMHGRATHGQTMPITMAATNRNDIIAAMRFKRLLSSIFASDLLWL
ncbi:MAG: hypothetical protein ACK4MF_11980, partial [Hyphomicrobiaceae bacterium]